MSFFACHTSTFFFCDRCDSYNVTLTEVSSEITAEVLVNEAAVVRAAVEARRTIPAEEDIRDHDGAIMPELTMQATQEILREADLILALCKANTKPRRTNRTGMSTSE